MKYILIVAAVFAAFIFSSCDPENVNNNGKDTDSIDVVWDAEKVSNIVLNNSGSTATSKYVVIAEKLITITKPGTYEITGTLSGGQIIVNTDDDGRVRLILDNVNISNSNTSPLFIANAERTILVLPAGTVNTFTDGTNYIITADSLNAPIYSKDDLVVFGDGTLNVNGKYRGGLTSRDELDILSGTIIVNSVTTGIRGKDNLRIENGTFSINCGGDALKADNDSSELKGFVTIKNGTFNIVSARGDGISATKLTTIEGGSFDITTGGGSTAQSDTASTKGIKGTRGVKISGGTFIINSLDNSIHSPNSIEISNGNFSISTGNRALKADSMLTVSGGEISVTAAFKGLSSHKLKFSGGNTTVNSRNDCLKATLGEDLTTFDGSSIEISGGTLLLTTAKGDAVDSNGDLIITGGTLVVQGSQTTPDDALSHRANFSISGGNLIAAGARTLTPTISSQNSVMIRFSSYLAPNSLICVQDENNNPLIIFKLQRYALYSLFSVPAFTTDKTFSVYTGGTASGIDKYGYYQSGAYTPGIKRGSFTMNAGFNSVNM